MSNFQVRHLGSSSSSRNSDLNLDLNVTHLGTVSPRKFDQLLDVNMTGVADGNLVSYDAATKTFIPYAGTGNIPLNLNLLSLSVSGITTLGNVRISSGIVTSSNPGITTVVYYGDGSKLTGVGGISTSSVNISGGLSGNLVYQGSPGITSFVPNGTIGQVLTFNGFIPVWANPTASNTGSSIRWSIDNGISYIGRAPAGISTSSPGWFVTRITPSPFATATATGAWANYPSLVYS